MINDNIDLMNHTLNENLGMDIIIVSSSNSKYQAFLHKRLTELKGKLIKPSAYIFSILEDWPHGAGNGLGTLYAYQKARETGLAEFGIDIVELQSQGASVALYHTAGEGTRMFPLTASELGCKTSIKLPGILPYADVSELISCIEAVIKQTSIYAQAGKGRLSVFWSDQIFLPEASPYLMSSAHIEIFAKFIPFPDPAAWFNHGYSNYGIIYKNELQKMFMVEKVEHATLLDLLASHAMKTGFPLGLSLGCFSLSLPILESLIQLFHTELKEKNLKLNTDTHFWMPLVFNLKSYIKHLQDKNISSDWATAHYNKMNSFKDNFLQSYAGLLLNAIDVGAGSFWCDYGMVSLYYKNNMLLVKENSAKDSLKKFFGWGKINSKENYPHLSLDKNSLLYNCNIKTGKIKNSILMNVTAQHVDISDSLILNANFDNLKAEFNIIYNCNEKVPCALQKELIKVDVNLSSLNKYLKFTDSIQSDTVKEWNSCLPHNPISYSELNDLIHTM